MGRFWIENFFVSHVSKDLSLSAQSVYICLKRHANRQAIAKIGASGIAGEMGITETTALKALRELRRKGLISDRVGAHSFGHYEIYPLQKNLYGLPRQIESMTRLKNMGKHHKNITTKELGINIKEEKSYQDKRTPEEQEHMNNTLADMRKLWGRRR